MEEFFYSGIWRMDWGLGNPNKTAVLIAELIIFSWTFTYWKRSLFWISLLCSAILGICLIHTFSRGGLAALLIGMLPVCLAFFFKLKKAYFVGILITIIVLIFFAVMIGASSRYVQGVSQTDNSILNRLEVWSHVPQMIMDAPDGWGSGESGKNYMRWYQPLRQREQYRTLVNSHFTWLVENGWTFRYFYIWGWITILFLCICAYQKKRLFSISLGMWLCLWVGAFFSSVGETFWVWILPVMGTAPLILNCIHSQFFINIKYWIITLVLPFLCPMSLPFLTKDRHFYLYYQNNQIRISEDPVIWILLQEDVFGEYEYARTLRKKAIDSEVILSVGFVRNTHDLPSNLKNKTLLIPKLENLSILKEFEKCEKIILYAPHCFPDDFILSSVIAGEIKIIFGEYSQSLYMYAWQEKTPIEILHGVSYFLTDWNKVFD